ncbi:MAG TPA: hypothetical protein DCQ94_13680 [Nitrospira sp.]|nr:hypothetical protein [Nitrospira sp.]
MSNTATLEHTPYATALQEDLGILSGTEDITLTHAGSSAIMSAVAHPEKPGVYVIKEFLHGWTDLKPGELIGKVSCCRDRYTLDILRVTKATGSQVTVEQVPTPRPNKKAKGDLLWRAADIEACFGAWGLAERTSDDGQFLELILPNAQRIPRRLEVMCLKYQIPPHVEHLPFEHQSFVVWADQIVRPLRCKGKVIALYLDDSGCRVRINLGATA